MGWETRGGRAFYYRKAREGGRVVSQYIGAGDVADAIAALDQADQADRLARLESERQERAELADLDRTVDEALRLPRALLAGALLSAGYRQHKRGVWRRARKEKS